MYVVLPTPETSHLAPVENGSKIIFLNSHFHILVIADFEDNSPREPKLNEKALCTNLFRSVVFENANIIYFFTKQVTLIWPTLLCCRETKLSKNEQN